MLLLNLALPLLLALLLLLVLNLALPLLLPARLFCRLSLTSRGLYSPLLTVWAFVRDVPGPASPAVFSPFGRVSQSSGPTAHAYYARC